MYQNCDKDLCRKSTLGVIINWHLLKCLCFYSHVRCMETSTILMINRKYATWKPVQTIKTKRPQYYYFIDLLHLVPLRTLCTNKRCPLLFNLFLLISKLTKLCPKHTNDIKQMLYACFKLPTLRNEYTNGNRIKNV